MRAQQPDSEATGTQASVTLRELVRDPRDRTLRAVLLLSLTFSAGFLDALSFRYLGHVFCSFMTGNILFVGLSAVRGERALLLRAVVSLVVFLAGAALGTLFLGRVPPRQTRRIWFGTLARYLLVEWLILLGFAIGWHLAGDGATNAGAQVVLLGVAAFAMGVQGGLVGALEIPGVISDALTGTVLQLANRLAERIDGKRPSQPLSTPLLIGLCLAYGTAAVAVTLLSSWPVRPFIPVILITVGIFTLLASHGRMREQSRRRSPHAAE